ncbi:DUF1592 domain-containing protein [Horticoccus sp. 23ND18S-11]|uniref:DUF1592 domain-containing protein n=1 Tax=Horticoccus sp. 23ND18S-11 TaxID=3391832 RepID=UPI0039C9F096
MHPRAPATAYRFRAAATCGVLFAIAIMPALRAASLPKASRAFIDTHCASCHDDIEKKGGLDLTALALNPDDPKNFTLWVNVHDRVSSGEMPPKKKTRPPAGDVTTFVGTLASTLTTAERGRLAAEGRATRRRLNRYEYENAVRDLLQAPWLQVKDWLPEDGEAFRFNKIGEALDVSHVQMARYLSAADYALKQVITQPVQRPVTAVTRYYAREQRSFMGPMKFSVFNTSPERATFPMLDRAPQPDVRAGKAPATVGAAEPAKRDLEGVGLVASTYEPIEPKFNAFKAPVGGRYRLRFNAFSVWVGPGKLVPGKPDRWWIPDLDDVGPGRRLEPITIYSETPPRLLRRLGAFDVGPEPAVQELDVWLLPGETIRPDAARLFRSRPGAGRWQNPLAEKDGQPGVVFRWLEVEGPIYDQWPIAGHTLLFGNLPVKPAKRSDGTVEVESAQPMQDAARLLAGFLARAYRRPVPETEVKRFLPVVEQTLKAGGGFTNAMLAAYTAVLCSPEFVTIEETPGRLDDFAVASRLAFFLNNSAPDDELRRLAANGVLRQPAVLRAQTDRLLNDAKSRRFVDAFLDYWLDLRRIVATAPDESLYPDYYLDDLLAESALEETELFFTELLRANLPARTLVSADFALLNEKLAAHYGLPPVEGVALRKVALPPGSVRGGLMTQASVLKVTANGTTTSPVVRGAWIMERLLGQPPPPPPPSVPAVEPDIRGASTIRQQLDKHRSEESCATCHTKIDPPGFALESFDVMGGYRERYRAMGEAGAAAAGLGRGGQKFTFRLALPVDCGGEMADGRTFADVRDFKRLLLADEAQIARNLARQFVVYATGAPVRFSDRPAVEKILQRAKADGYGVRSVLHAVVQSELFLNK